MLKPSGNGAQPGPSFLPDLLSLSVPSLHPRGEHGEVHGGVSPAQQRAEAHLMLGGHAEHGGPGGSAGRLVQVLRQPDGQAGGPAAAAEGTAAGDEPGHDDDVRQQQGDLRDRGPGRGQGETGLHQVTTTTID